MTIYNGIGEFIFWSVVLTAFVLTCLKWGKGRQTIYGDGEAVSPENNDDLNREAMRGLWWPDPGWRSYFDGGVECYRRGEKNPPWPGADTYADVMANQGFLYAQALAQSNLTKGTNGI